MKHAYRQKMQIVKEGQRQDKNIEINGTNETRKQRTENNRKSIEIKSKLTINAIF